MQSEDLALNTYFLRTFTFVKLYQSFQETVRTFQAVKSEAQLKNYEEVVHELENSLSSIFNSNFRECFEVLAY